MRKVVSAVCFTAVALLVLVIGYCGAEVVWRLTHHRYETPNTGAYYGAVSARFSSVDDSVYSFSFSGTTPVKWYWIHPTNFTYSALEMEWRGNGSEGSATLKLPEFTYYSANSTGAFSREVLAEWLVGNIYSASTEDLQGVDLIYANVDAARRGSLPPPSHHGVSFADDAPVIGHVQHFLLGYGIDWLVFLWVAVWLFAVICLALKIRGARGSKSRGPGFVPKPSLDSR